MMKNERMRKHASNVKETDILDRDEILELLGRLIKEASVKVGSLRIKDVATFKARVEGLRTLSYSLSIYKTILADSQIDSLTSRIDALEGGVKK